MNDREPLNPMILLQGILMCVFAITLFGAVTHDHVPISWHRTTGTIIDSGTRSELVEFTTDDGSTIRTRIRGDYGAEGAKIDVSYDPDNPDRAKRSRNIVVTGIGYLFATVVFVAGAGALTHRWWMSAPSSVSDEEDSDPVPDGDIGGDAPGLRPLLAET